jgi:hypothetical protein
MNSDLVFKAVAVLTTTLVAINQWRSLRFRSNLKTDLEILKMYNESCGQTRSRQLIENKIEKLVARTYQPNTPVNRGAAVWFGLSIFCILAWLFLFLSHGLTPLLAVFFVVSMLLAVGTFRGLRG